MVSQHENDNRAQGRETEDPAGGKRGPEVRARGEPRTSTMPMIGIGLRATATADGSSPPMASPSTGASSQAPADLGGFLTPPKNLFSIS